MEEDEIVIPCFDVYSTPQDAGSNLRNAAQVVRRIAEELGQQMFETHSGEPIDFSEADEEIGIRMDHFDCDDGRTAFTVSSISMDALTDYGVQSELQAESDQDELAALALIYEALRNVSGIQVI